MTFEQKRQWLVDRNYIVGLRLPNRNTDFEGDYSVCAGEICGDTTRDASDGFCIVGYSLEELVDEAYENFCDDDPEADPETALDDQDPDMGDCGSDFDKPCPNFGICAR